MAPLIPLFSKLLRTIFSFIPIPSYQIIAKCLYQQEHVLANEMKLANFDDSA